MVKVVTLRNDWYYMIRSEVPEAVYIGKCQIVIEEKIKKEWGRVTVRMEETYEIRAHVFADLKLIKEGRKDIYCLWKRGNGYWIEKEKMEKIE